MRKLIMILPLLAFSCSSMNKTGGWIQKDNPPMEKAEDKESYSSSSFEPFVEEEDAYQSKKSIPLKLDYDEKLYRFWMKYYTKKKNKARFSRHLTNGESFRKIVRKIYREEGLPEDLFYVGLIESGFNTHIKSHASAKGPWQFMSGTAKDYGLRVDKWVDERTNIHKATRAAAHYFKDLYNIFGSWELALCAYNAGENRIIRAIRKGNSRNYKELVKKKLIPKETTYYIPKVAAAMELAKNRQRYGINVSPNPTRQYAEAVVLKVASPFSLNKVGKDLGVSMKTLKKFNPDIKTGWVHITKRRKYRLILPRSVKDKLANTKIGGEKMPRRYLASVPTGETYRVRRGDSLYTIARKSGTTISELKRINGLRSHKIRIGQRLKLAASSKQVANNSPRSVNRNPASAGKSSVHKVKSGDNLGAIARKYKMSLPAIKKMNNLRNSKIRIGQRLKVKMWHGYRGDERAPASIEPASFYKVRKGDNLAIIAKRYQTSVKDLKRRNNMNKSFLRIGQKLKVPALKTKTYVVKRGDNLLAIARRFRTSVKRIVSFNGMRSNRIFPKQKLQIPL